MAIDQPELDLGLHCNAFSFLLWRCRLRFIPTILRELCHLLSTLHSIRPPVVWSLEQYPWPWPVIKFWSRYVSRANSTSRPGHQLHLHAIEEVLPLPSNLYLLVFSRAERGPLRKMHANGKVSVCLAWETRRWCLGDYQPVFWSDVVGSGKNTLDHLLPLALMRELINLHLRWLVVVVVVAVANAFVGEKRRRVHTCGTVWLIRIIGRIISLFILSCFSSSFVGGQRAQRKC